MIAFDDVEYVLNDKREYSVTTLDNPYNPYEDYDKWYLYDEMAGYHTCGLLARLLVSSYDLSDEEQDDAMNLAMNDLLRLNPTGNYIKVYEKEVVNV